MANDDLTRDEIFTYPSIFTLVACAPKTVPVDEVEAHVRMSEPCGTSAGWVLSDEVEPVACEDEDDRLHYLFGC